MVFKGFMPLGDGCILLIGESFKFGFIENEVLTGWDVVGDKFGILLTEVEDENRGVFKSCDSDIFRHRLFFLFRSSSNHRRIRPPY